MLRSAVALLVLLPTLAAAGERILILKTREDAQQYPADKAFCLDQKYPVLNVVLGASVWSLQSNAARGVVMKDEIRLLGAATGCGMMTSADPFVPKQPFAIKFELAGGTYVAKGQCDIVSNDVPQAGLMLAGCALTIVEAPAGIVGGIATSASVFNPKQVGDFATGSVWTVHLYTAD